MFRYYITSFLVFSIIIVAVFIKPVNALLPLSGKLIIVDPGHGGKDAGTSSNGVLEKDLNLEISLKLEKELIKSGASVLLTRDGDYDLSSPNVSWRKKSDFDNRIEIINRTNADYYISIHLNYLNDSSYYGPQVFYNKSNKQFALVMQDALNSMLQGEREIKTIPTTTYMYSKLRVPGLLIECGFLSNYQERQKLMSIDYQEQVAKAIVRGIINYSI